MSENQWETVNLVGVVEEVGNSFLIPDDNLEKKGRIGKLVSKNRRAFICIVLVLLAIGFLSIVVMTGYWLFGTMRLVASGYHYAFGESELSHNAVRMESGAIIYRVIEPVKIMNDVTHARLLNIQLQSKRKKRRLITADDVRSGYMQWMVSEIEGEHNFTLAVARKLAQSVAESTCVCYGLLGIAENIVYLRASDEVLYEPDVVSEPQPKNVVRIKSECTLHKLLKQARQYDALDTNNDYKDEARDAAVASSTGTTVRLSAARGVVEYIAENGYKRRRMFYHDQYPCIKHCISFFDDATLDEHSVRQKLYSD